jgi:hypothetical protein
LMGFQTHPVKETYPCPSRNWPFPWREMQLY